MPWLINFFNAIIGLITSTLPMRATDKHNFLFMPPDKELLKLFAFEVISISVRYSLASFVASLLEAPLSCSQSEI